MAYHNLIFDKNHEKIAIVFDIYDNENEFVLIVKDLKSNKFFPSIITEVTDTIAFDHFSNFFFIRKNEL